MKKVYLFIVFVMASELAIFITIMHFIWNLSSLHGRLIAAFLMFKIVSNFSKEVAIDAVIMERYNKYLEEQKEKETSED